MGQQPLIQYTDPQATVDTFLKGLGVRRQRLLIRAVLERLCVDGQPNVNLRNVLALAKDIK